MDPDINLAYQLRSAKHILRIWENCDENGMLSDTQTEIIAALAQQLALHVEALDEWLTKGGFLPQRWAARF